MSRLAELIAQLCPDGVEYRPLGELGSFFGGLSGKSKSDFVEIENAHPFVTYKEVYSLIEIAQCPQGRVAVLPHEKQLALCRGDVLFTGSSENADEVGLTAVVTTDFSEPVYLNSFSMCLRWHDATFDSGYAKYLFTSSEVRRQIRRCASGVTRFNLSKKRLEGVRIPIPPLEVQREIARILDQFTTLEAKLEEELEARRTQYEHYRNHLLSYESLSSRGPVEMVKLGEMLDMRAGTSISSKYIFEQADSDCIYPCYGANGLRGYVQSMNHEHDASVIGRQGALCGNVTYACGPFFATEHAVVVTPRVELSQRWLYHSLIVANLSQYATKSAQPGLSVRRVAEVEIPVPSVSEQYRIAELLDHFDALVNDITSGLPAEIAARRAQYEYYRDRLLSFPEKAVSGSGAS